MPLVQLENGDQLQFDDNYSEDQIGQAVDEYMSGQYEATGEGQNQPQEEPQQTQESSNPYDKYRRSFGRDIGLAARTGIQAAASPVTFIGDLTTMAGNKLTGTKTQLPSQVVSNQLTKLGLPEASTPAERIVTNVAEAATGSGLASKAIRNYGPALAQRLISKTPAIDATIAGSSALASSAAGEAGASPAVQIGLGLAGGLAGGKIAAPKPSQVTSQNVQDLASQSYKVADEKGALWMPSFTDKFLAKAEGITPQTEAGKLLAGDAPITKIVEKLQGLKGQGMDLKSAQEIDEFLGDAVDSLSDKGVMTKEGKKVLQLQTELRNLMDDAPDTDILGGKEGIQALKEGRRLWSRAAKLRDVEKIITRSEMTDNPATALKTGFRNLYMNPARMRGFTKDEVKMIKNAAESGIITDSLRTMGSRLIPIGSAIGGGGLPATIAAQAGTMAARGAATKLQLSKANKLADAIANKAIPQPKQPNKYPVIPLGMGVTSNQNQ